MSCHIIGTWDRLIYCFYSSKTMAKKYCKYTKEELQEYCNDQTYCVKCVDGNMHISLPPWGLKKFEETVTSIVSAEKLNRFDSKLNGIVLDIQSIKVIGEEYAMRNDSSALHVSLKVKFYVFEPRIGAVLNGIVKHVALHHISVTIHRFFNVTIPLETKNSTLKTNMTVMVKLTKFDLDDSIPYFEGKLEEILWQDQKENSMDSGVSTTDSTNLKLKHERITNGRNEKYSDNSNSDSDTSRTKLKQEINGSMKTTPKVKQEPVSSSESSQSTDSDSDLPSKSKTSINKRAPEIQLSLKKEVKHRPTSSSDDSSSSSDENETENRKKTFNSTKTLKRKRTSESSIIGESLLKMRKLFKDELDSESKLCKDDSDSVSSNDIGFKKKNANTSMNDISFAGFASPGLSSTKIFTKTAKTKTQGKDSGTNDFLKKMMSRFDK